MNSMMNNLARIQPEYETRSICPENLTGERGAGGMCELENGSAQVAAADLGKGWKVNPYLVQQPGEILTLADFQGEGIIRHIWLTPTGVWRDQIIRFYWDGCETPAIECPLGDFFACGWGKYAQISSAAVCVNPGSAFNCYWTMPFRKGFRITLENRNDQPCKVYYQVDFEVGPVPQGMGYFHAQFRRVNPLKYGDVFTVLDGVEGQGQYVGTYMLWASKSEGWWGEGEIKFYLDGDQDYPTICGTGTEDYFCGSYNFEDPVTHDHYVPFSTPYSGLPQVITPNTLYRSQMRFAMYRWHVTDPIRFRKDIRVTIQALGWRSGKRYQLLQDEIAAVAFFYLDKPCAALPQLPDRHGLEIL